MKAKKLVGRCFVVALLFFCWTVLADPLNNWTWRNPLPNGNPPSALHQLYGIVFTNGTFFGVGVAGVVSMSIDTTNWTESQTASSNQLNNIIYAGGQFVAVGNSGTVETSSDGTNWILQTSGTTGSLSQVAYGDGRYVAAGSTIIASLDGVHWSPAVSGLSSASGVAGSSAGFVAVNGSTNAFFSTDGLNWTANALSEPNIYRNPFDPYYPTPLGGQIVTYYKGVFLVGGWLYPSSGVINLYVDTSVDGKNWPTNVFVANAPPIDVYDFYFFMNGPTNVIAAGQGYSPFSISSADGTNWTSAENTLNNTFQVPSYAGAYGNGSYIVVGSYGAINTSTDGVNWVNKPHGPPPPTGPTNTFNSIAYNNGTYVVASSNLFVLSTNDLVYNAVSNIPSLSCVTAFGSCFVGVGTNGAVYQSSDGISWTPQVSGTANNLHGVAGGGNQLVAVGDSGVILTSPDGITWSSRVSPTSLPLYGVAYSNGLYVAVGQLGTIVTSPDGVTWTKQGSGHNLYSVTYGSAGFLAVGASGTILTSLNGANWTSQNAGTSATFYSATFGNGYYLIAGSNAVVKTSPDGVNWTSRNIGATGGQTFYGSAFLDGRFDVVGSGGGVIESDAVAPLFDLQIHGKFPQNSFTFFATPGSSFRLVSSPALNGNIWSTVATFNNAAAITLWTNSTAAGDPGFLRLISP